MIVVLDQLPIPSSEVHDSGDRCLACGYNLTGNVSNLCPECGQAFDRSDLRDPEVRRVGTPVHRARGFLKIPALAWTFILAAFAPRRFARQLRVDEFATPPCVILLASIAISGSMVGYRRFSNIYYGIFFATSAVIIATVPSVVFLSLLSSSGGSKFWSFSRRIKAFAVLFCYTSWFIMAWFFLIPTHFVHWNDPYFYWPFVYWPYYSEDAVARSVLFYWWFLIIWCFVLVRTRPRMLAILLLPLVLAISRFGLLVYDAIIPRLAR